MKRTIKTSIALAVIGISLSGCASTAKLTDKYAAMSCQQLAEKIGVHRAMRATAQVDEIVSGVKFILADDDADYIEAGIEGLASTGMLHDSKRRLEVLRSTSADKRC